MTAITTTRPTVAQSLKQAIVRHPLIAYFLLAFVGSWGVQIPLLISQDGFGLLPYTLPMLPAMALFLLSVWAGPALAALVVTATESGRAGVRAHLRRFLHWRVGLRWYFLALLGYPILYVLAATVFMGVAPLPAVASRWTLFFTSYLPNLLLFQGFTQWAEEPGWRGFALPRMQERFGPTPASLLLGLLHMLWHLPVYSYIGGPVPLGPFDLSTFALATAVMTIMTIAWTWVYNNTGGSILMAVLLHSSLNASGPLVGQLVPAFPDESSVLLQGAYVIIPLLLVLCTRGRLSYHAGTAQANTARPNSEATEPHGSAVSG